MIRIIYSNNGTLQDLTQKLNRYDSGSQAFSWVAAEDALFIGSYFPFNRKFFSVSSVNSTPSVATVSVWDGSNFTAVADLMDDTEEFGTSGTVFSADGYMRWIPNRNEGWQREDTQDSGGTELITGLGSKNIYDMYWLKITLSVDCSFTLDWLGDVFCRDADLDGIYRELGDSDFKTAYESGKTSWEEQIVIASQLVTQDLIKRGYVKDGAQILDYEDLKLPTVYRTAHLIYSTLGEGYNQIAIDALNLYEKQLILNNLVIDKNNNADIDMSEVKANNAIYRFSR